MEKSVVSFSRNVDLEMKNMLVEKLNFKAVEDHDTYLGLPTYLGSSKKEVFRNIQERVWKKLKGWKERYLSQAGREILIKSVAQAIPIYAMQCFKLPQSIINDLDKMCRSFFWGQRDTERRIPWISWENLCRSKKEGGMGFRNLGALNKALLAKQGWRVLTEENSLMARVYKGKYFPNSSFLNAKLGSNSSYTWRSIMQSRDVVSKGVTKVIGNGAKTWVWTEPWLRGMHGNGCLPSRIIHGQNIHCVQEIIEGGEWNLALASNYLNPNEMQLLRGMKLPIFSHDDFWSWKFSKNGSFSVKSAYYRVLSEERGEKPNSSGGHHNALWKRVWHAKVPPKVRNFAWRALCDALPVYVSLARRGLNVDSVCRRCGESDEDVNHLLLGCRESRLIFYQSPLLLQINLSNGLNFWGWVELMIEKIKEDRWWDIFWELCWVIWLARNGWVFTKTRRGVQWWVGKAMATVKEYASAIEKKEIKGAIKVAGVSSVDKWQCPPLGWFKLNSDAAVRDGKVGVGALLRDGVGDVLVPMCDEIKGCYDVEVCEAMALRRGMQISLEAGFSSLIVEVDCLKVVHAIKRKVKDRAMSGMVIADILQLMSLCSKVEIRHVRRKTNEAAHGLAKASLEYGELRVWLEEFPVCIASHVSNDLC